MHIPEIPRLPRGAVDDLEIRIREVRALPSVYGRSKSHWQDRRNVRPVIAHLTVQKLVEVD